MIILASTILCFIGFGSCTMPELLQTGGRELVPPQAGIRVGSLYYVREPPTQDISKPAHLIPLCTANLARYRVKPQSYRVADIDLFDTFEASAALDGVRAQFAQLGLSGSLGDYYSYSLTNVVETDITKVEADRIFDERGERNDCAGWRKSMRGLDWGVYQVLGISTGDIHFARSNTASLSANVEAKIVNFEPKLKAAIKRASGLVFSGKGLVVSFQPILRN